MRPRRPRRLDRLGVLPALRLRRLLRSAPRRGGERPLDPRAARRQLGRRSPLPAEHARPRDGLGDRHGRRPRHRLHAAAREGAGHRPHRRGPARRGRDELGARDPVRLRLDDPMGAAHGRRPHRRRRTGRALLPHAGREPRREHAHDRRVHRARGRPRPLRPHLVPVERAAAGCDRSRARARRDHGVLGRLERPLRVRRQVARRRPPLPDRSQGADVRADRWNRGRGDDVAPGETRRRAQLGLPVLLAARRHPHAARLPQRRVSRRGARMASLAPPRRRGRRVRAPDHVRRRRRAAAAGVHGRLAARLRGLAAGACRQRGQRAVPAGRLRRGARRAPSRPPPEPRALERGVGAARGGSSATSRRHGRSPTRGSGRSADRDGTSRTRR